MQTGNITSANNFSVNILDIQNGQNTKPSAAEDINRSLFRPAAPQTGPSVVSNQSQQQSMSPAGVGQNINITA
jgi:hypothetical protein